MIGRDLDGGAFGLPAVPLASFAGSLGALGIVYALSVARRRGTSGTVLLLGGVAVAALLTYEHTLVSEEDLRKLDAAFFTMNGVISIVFFTFILVDRFI